MASPPLLPAGYDVVWSATFLAPLVLTLWALVRWFRRDDPAILNRALDAVIIVLVPVIGPLAYLLATHRSRDARAHRRGDAR